MDLIIKNARIGDEAVLQDIGIDGGRIVAIEPSLVAEGEALDVDGRLATPGFVETHIHLDKSCVLERCAAEQGDIAEAIEQVARVKSTFTADDVYQRGARTLTKAILNGTTHMRTHLEVDPTVGLRSWDGIRRLVGDFKWAIDLEICVFPQEGLLNNPGTDELMVAALDAGADVVGAAPYTDTDPHGQIDRIFEMAQSYDVDIDMHLDFGHDPSDLDLDYVCALTERHGWGGRVAIGHVTKLSAADPARLEQAARRMADAGVALTVLPSTDLYLMGRHMDHNVMRGVTPAHVLLRHGVNCSLSSNNILNPFTPFGDCSQIRMANLYANICQVGARADILECFAMIAERSAKLMRLKDYGLEVGKSADLVIIDAPDRASAVAELSAPLLGFKRGRPTFTRQPAVLHAPS